jgi:hypothetical protein
MFFARDLRFKRPLPYEHEPKFCIECGERAVDRDGYCAECKTDNDPLAHSDE